MVGFPEIVVASPSLLKVVLRQFYCRSLRAGNSESGVENVSLLFLSLTNVFTTQEHGPLPHLIFSSLVFSSFHQLFLWGLPLEPQPFSGYLSCALVLFFASFFEV